PDPTYWVKWQLGTLVPRLLWKEEWDEGVKRFSVLNKASSASPSKKIYIGIHLHTETKYGYEKNWPLSHFEDLFDRLIDEKGREVILFGHRPHPVIERPGLIDLRGKTRLIEMLSIIKNCCSHLLVPDSGILSVIYYLDLSFPIQIVSLWADPRQGILKQGVASPNPELTHTPLVAKNGDLTQVSVVAVLEALSC
ncbi:MAG: glycosyltransferase family 9 protein, partial [Anaerolineae bacterium]